MRIYSVFENEQWIGDMTADDISQMLKYHQTRSFECGFICKTD